MTDGIHKTLVALVVVMMILNIMEMNSIQNYIAIQISVVTVSGEITIDHYF